MNNEILSKLGLNDNQIIVYTTLLTEGPSKAGTLSKKTPLKRGLVYKTLEELIELELVNIDDPEAKVMKYAPAHPNALKDVSARRLADIESANAQLDHELGSLVSQYNLASGKPGVEFYEGEKGVKKALYETLDSTEVVYTYADIEAIDDNASKINKEYVTERLRKKVTNKLLVVDTPISVAVAQQEKSPYTEFRLIKNEDAPPFNAVMKIYDNKILYATFANNFLTATIINDPAIHKMHKYLFEVLWDKSRSVL